MDGSSPDKAGPGQYYQMAWAAASVTERSTTGTCDYVPQVSTGPESGGCGPGAVRTLRG